MAADAAADAVVVEDGGEELPAFVLGDLAFGLVAADLLVERVEELLAGGGAGEGGALVERAAEAAEVEQAFGGAVEGDAHAVEQVDDGRALRGHVLDGGLVGEEVAAVDGVVEVLEDGVALALEVLGGVDAALGADGVRALDGDDREEVDGAAGFGDLDDGGEAGEASAYDDDAGCCCCHCLVFPLFALNLSKRSSQDVACNDCQSYNDEGPAAGRDDTRHNQAYRDCHACYQR